MSEPSRPTRPTPGQTIGPFFPFALPFDGDRTLVPPGSPGAVRLHGHVYDGEGSGLADALVEVRQADPSGRVPRVAGSMSRGSGPFTGWGRCATDPGGHFWFSTLEPGAASPSAAPFFAVTVFARGLLDGLFLRIYLPEADAASDPFLWALDEQGRRRTTAVREDDGSIRFDIHLQGDRESLFLTFEET